MEEFKKGERARVVGNQTDGLLHFLPKGVEVYVLGYTTNGNVMVVDIARGMR